MNIVVLGGGISPEREISLRSSSSVAKALEEAGYDVVFIDPRDGLKQLDQVTPGTIVFPILHGAGGEDGILQAELEKRQLPYLGTKDKESAVCFDKALMLQSLIQASIPVAEGAVVDQTSYWQNELIKTPHVLKVTKGGSSIGTYIVRDPAKIDKKNVQEVFSLDDKAIIERLIEGIEITVPILDSAALPVIEIRPPKNREFDYETKYDGSTQELCPPESVDASSQISAQRLAERVHKALGARHLSRVDIIVQTDGNLIVLELNTIPGMTEQSLYPKSAAVAGITMVKLVRKFAELVSRDYNISI